MNRVQRSCVCASIAFLSFISYSPVKGGSNSTTTETANREQFSWSDHTKLTWEDFKGEVNAPREESAAATYCSIGFKTIVPAPDSLPEIVVYNAFYVNKSWVRSDAKIPSILDHEQGHFDLCEIYTRKFKDHVSSFKLNSNAAKQQLLDAYADLSKEYEARQQAYEEETAHGTNMAEQKRWQDMIARELSM